MRKTAPAIAAIAAALSIGTLSASAQGCPPGLAKKSPACVPPGLAKRGDHDRHGRDYDWRQGDVLQGDYVIVRERQRYGLPPLRAGEQYYRMGDRILRVDDNTKTILDVVALAASALD